MFNEILTGKMPHDTSQTIRPMFYMLLSPQVTSAEASSHSLWEITDNVEKAADPYGGGSGAAPFSGGLIGIKPVCSGVMPRRMQEAIGYCLSGALYSPSWIMYSLFCLCTR